MKISILAVCLLVITTAAHNPLCSVELPGCGNFDAPSGESCDCMAYTYESFELQLAVYCSLNDSSIVYPECCPCTAAATLQVDLNNCASEGNLRMLSDLFALRREIARDVTARCPPPITEECVGERNRVRLDCSLQRILFVSADINVECGLARQ